MGLITTIKDWIYKGGAAIGMVEELQNITDHPRINIDPTEYQRINENVNIYRGHYPKVKYVNSNAITKERNYITLNMMKTVSETMASLVFNEQCEISVAGKTIKNEDGSSTETESKANDFIQHVMEHNDFKKNFSKYIESMFAMGGLVARPYVNAGNGEIEFAWAQAPSFYPLRSNTNKISEGALSTVTTQSEGKDTYYYTLLEFHKWIDGSYVITNELYKSKDRDIVGRKVNLKEIYPELQETAELINLSRPQFAYLKPNGFNNINPYSPLGLGVCDNCKNTLKQINDTFDQFNWEIRMGQRKVIVSDHFLTTTYDRTAAQPKQVFDDDTNIFIGLKTDQDDMKTTDITHDIRTEQYVGAINQFFKTLEMQTKLSVGTFSFDGQSVKTATEVISENSMTYRTRNAHIIEVEKFIKELIVSVCELGKATKNELGQPIYNGEIPTFEEIGIDFDDGIFTDKNQQLEFYGKAKTLGLIPDIEVLQRIWDIPEETAIEWLEKINQDSLNKNPDHQQTMAEVSMLGREEV